MSERINIARESMRALVVILVFLTARPAFGLDITVGSYQHCSDWLKEREELKNWILNGARSGVEMPKGTWASGGWVIGFLEGYEWACPTAERPRTYGMDANAVYDRLDAICTKKPEVPLWIAASELTRQLDPKHSLVCEH